jgi:hypothetical protein
MKAASVARQMDVCPAFQERTGFLKDFVVAELKPIVQVFTS